MKANHRLLSGILTAVAVVWFSTTVQGAEKLPVFVSILPQKYFVTQIGGDLVNVQVIVRPGANPATYEPKPRQMAALTKARLYFAIGVPFESVWLDKFEGANPEMKVVHTEHGIKKQPIAAHRHKRNNGHYKTKAVLTESENLDPHIWLSPPLVMIQARTIRNALQAADPVHRDEYDSNCKQFIAEIVRLDAKLKQVLAGRSGMQFMVFHPSWGYFAQAYGLKQMPVEIEGKKPKPAQLKELIEHARESGIRFILVQPQFSIKSAELVAKEIGGRIVYADPLAEAWSSNLLKVARELEARL